MTTSSPSPSLLSKFFFLSSITLTLTSLFFISMKICKRWHHSAICNSWPCCACYTSLPHHSLLQPSRRHSHSHSLLLTQATAMTRLKRRNLQSAVGMPEDISKGSLDALGYEIHWSPYWPQAVQV